MSLPAPIVVVEVGGSSMRGGRFQPDRLAVTGTRRRRSPGLATAGGEAEVLHVLRGLVDEVAAGASARRRRRGLSGADRSGRHGDRRADAAWWRLQAAGAEVRARRLVAGCRRARAERPDRRRLPRRGRRRARLLHHHRGQRHRAQGVRARALRSSGQVGVAASSGTGRSTTGSMRRPCDCGGRGHLGGIASGRGALALVRHALVADPVGGGAALGIADAQDLDNAIVVSAYRSGDPWVGEALAPAITELGRALAGVHTIVGTERFVLVGGFARAMGEAYRRAVAASAAGTAGRSTRTGTRWWSSAPTTTITA